MFANASDKYLDILLPENRMYGFAISQALDAVLPDVDGSGIDNQPQSTTYDKDKPQAIDRFWGCDELADIPDFYAWQLRVTIDSEKDFDQQVCYLTHYTEVDRNKDHVWVNSVGYDMSLRAAMHLLRQPTESRGMLLGCFETCDKECGDYIIPISALLKRSGD